MKAIALIHFIIFGFAATGTASPLVQKVDAISLFLESNASQVDPGDLRYIERDLHSIEYLLRPYGFNAQRPHPFRLSVADDTLKIYDRATDTLLYTWNQHDEIEIRGNVVGLLDSGKEFAAFRYQDGEVIKLVSNWQDTIQYQIRQKYIGLLDSDGIVDVYSSLEQKELVNNWQNTVQVAFEPEYFALLDNETAKNFEIYDSTGNKFAHFTGVSSFRCLSPYVIEFIKDGNPRTIDVTNYLP